jgi:peptide/nickel transport system substrate-binding protein
MFTPSSRQWRVVAVLVLVLLLIGSVVGVHAQGGGTLRIGATAPQSLDPALGSNDPEVLFNRSIYDYLIEVKTDRSIAPNLAKEWKINDDGLTYTFTLEQGVKFHDGSDFSADDVVFTYNRLKEIKSPAVNLLGEYEVSAADAGTVVFTLKSPNADFLYGVAGRLAFILKKGSDKPNTMAEGDKPYANFNGTGPFMLTELKQDERAVLKKNPNYWKQGQPLLDEVQFIFIKDVATQVNALRSGQVDFVFKITPDLLSTLEGEANIALFQKATNLHPVIRLRTDQGPGKDPKVRQAFKLATDREQLNELILEGRGVVGNNDPIGPSYGDFFAKDIPNPKRDPQKACELIKEAGFADGVKLTLQTVNALGYDQLAVALRDQWKDACINVEVQVNEEGFYYADDNPNNWLKADLGITGWGDRPIAQQYLTEAYQSKGIYNETHWADPELDELIAKASVTTDVKARAEIYRKISEIFNDRGPIIIPWFAPVFGATNKKVQGLDMAPFPGQTDLRGVSVSG